MMLEIGILFETSLTTYQTTRCYMLEDNHLRNGKMIMSDFDGQDSDLFKVSCKKCKAIPVTGREYP
jgi:hypothetical protein